MRLPKRFLSTLPVRGATIQSRPGFFLGAISIHAPREGSDELTRQQARDARISIHAPREGSDISWPYSVRALEISIHAPREGSDNKRPNRMIYNILFLSTLPARGATWPKIPSLHPFCISIHAPREGSDVHGEGHFLSG